MNLLLALAFIIFLVGLVIRVKSWFAGGIGTETIDTSSPRRFSLALTSMFRALLSSAVISAFTTLVTDILLQKRLLQHSIVRWLAHLLIVTGFVLLLLMHGLGSNVSNYLFSDYYATLQPYLSLRNVFAVMVLAGLGLASYRRLRERPQRVQNDASDWLAIGFVAAIICSGILLESSKISSYSYYQGMVETYGDIGDEQEALALETYWASEHGLISPRLTKPYNPELVAQGKELSSYSCVECHAPTSGAFVSFALAKLIGPLIDRGDGWLYVSHLVICLAFLAWLPWSKMFHLFSVPVSLLINGSRGFKQPVATTAGALNRHMIGLSACTHCGSCSERCSSLMFYESFQNDFILPSEKVTMLKKLAAGKPIAAATRKRLQQGLYICTSCDRCSTICPSGINLRELFITARYHLLAEGPPETSLLSHFSFPLALAQHFVDDHLKALKKVEEQFKTLFQKLADLPKLTISSPEGLDDQSFRSCYSCQRCTNICPVVRLYDHPQEALDLLPHQLIFSLGIGQTELAAGSQMIWSCSTCYLCQEHCPNQVALTDIFYALKNRAIKKIDTGGTQ